MNIYYVYQYLRSKDSDIAESGTPYYIGKGKNNRAWVKEHETPKPTDKSLIEILITNMSEKAAHELEILLIKQYGRIDLGTGILRNKTNGGEGKSGVIVSTETRTKIGIANQNPSKEKRAKMSAANHNRAPISEETRAKIRAASTGRKHSAETKAKLSSMNTGKIVSTETRNKIGAAHAGRKHSLAARGKMSVNRKGKAPWNKGGKHSAETQNKNKKN